MKIKAGDHITTRYFTDEMREQVLRPATLNDVDGTQGRKRIAWINSRPYVLKEEAK